MTLNTLSERKMIDDKDIGNVEIDDSEIVFTGMVVIYGIIAAVYLIVFGVESIVAAFVKKRFYR